MGATQARPRGDAGDAARLHHDRHALHHLGAGRRGGDAARVPLRRTQRDPSLPVRRPLQRPGPSAPRRRAGPRGGCRGGDHRADVLDQRGAHARVLRRPCGRARRLRRHGRPLPQGSRRSPDQAAVRELAPHFLRAARGRPVELHSHCTIGLAPFVYVEGLRAGFDALHTAVAPLARGTSNPAAETTLRDLEAEGFWHRLDVGRSRRDVGALPGARAQKGLPVGEPQEFDSTYYHHQLAGGMVSTTQRMLDELRRPELFRACSRRSAAYGAEIGYAIIVTPVSHSSWPHRPSRTSSTTSAASNVPRTRPSATSSATTATRPRRSTRRRRPRPLPAARRGVEQGSSHSVSRRREPASGRVHLRRGASPPADDAPGAGGRDARVAGPAADAAERPAGTGAHPVVTLLHEVAASQVDHVPGRCARETTGWCGAVRLDDVGAFVLDVDGTLVHRDGEAVHVQPGAARC